MLRSETSGTVCGILPERNYTATDAIQEALAGRASQAHKLEQAVAQWEEQVRAADQQVEELQEKSKQEELRLVELRRQEEQTKKKRDQAHLDVEEQQRRIHLLEELERNLEGFAHSVKTILRESSKGALPGVHGPISRLIAVPKEYAVAIETALGAAMQNIVVQTEEDAKAAIQFLKQKNSGRATFLPLSTIQESFLVRAGAGKIPWICGDCRSALPVRTPIYGNLPFPFWEGLWWRKIWMPRPL